MMRLNLILISGNHQAPRSTVRPPMPTGLMLDGRPQNSIIVDQVSSPSDILVESNFTTDGMAPAPAERIEWFLLRRTGSHSL